MGRAKLMLQRIQSQLVMLIVYSTIILIETTLFIGSAGAEKNLFEKSDTRDQVAEVTPQEHSPQILNNFVFELLNATSPAHESFSFGNPREGWVFISISASHIAIAPSVEIDNEKYQLRRVGEHFETMRYLLGGQHKIKVSGGIIADSLILRAVPELFYSMYGAGPLVPETGNYSWDWLRKHVLDHYNAIIGIKNTEKQEDEITEWNRQGGRWYTQSNIPWVDTVEAAYEYWAKEPGMSQPLLRGIWADEFGTGEKYEKMYPIWCEALHRIHSDPRFKGRKFYAYMGMRYNSSYDTFIKTIMENDFRLAPEWYLREQPNEEKLWAYIDLKSQQKNRAAIDTVFPGAAENRVIVLGIFSQPEESCDIYPHINYDVFLDIQLHAMANDPAFSGTRGLQGYYSPYAGEEQTRLLARLIRHYAIEGHKDRMLKDPYILTHLKNPDFTEGTSGWLLSAAAEGCMMPRKVEGFGWLQGRYDRSGLGDTVLWTKRSKDKSNVFMQEIKELQPGRLYSLRFFTGNYKDYLEGKSRDCKHSVSVRIDSVDQIPEKCFQARIKSNYAHTYKSFNRTNPYRLNYHQIIFRARGEKAKLQFSDWVSATMPGGPEGEELIWNFIQVQPYFVED
jgi:hypothetical protein